MKTFAIKIIDTTIRESYNMPCCIGEITIGDFQEAFEMPLVYWTMQDYEKQWQEGIERIKTHGQSCLVFEMQDPTKSPWANTWVLYKEGNVIHIQNNLLQGKRFSKMLKKEPYTMETCYNFIIPRETICSDTGMKISEWDVDLEEVVKYKVPSSNSGSSFDTHGILIFNKGNNWITADHSHNGGRWKMFNSKGKRKGTYDKDLNYIKD